MADEALKKLYLDLMKRVLTNLVYQDPNVSDYEPKEFVLATRIEGKDWPRDAHTMVGIKRLNNLENCLNQILADNIPGDIVETGVWRGGASIFMCAMLKANDVSDRVIWLADSFQGLPPPNSGQYPADAGDNHHTFDYLAIPLETVKENFSRYGLLDGQVKFLKGWFRDTLPTAPISKISLLRMDGDMYESTMDTLTNLYHKVSPGGFIVVDDYKAIPACRMAVDEFRELNSIAGPITEIDWAGVFWRKS